MPEQEPSATLEIPGSTETEKKEPTYTRDQVIEAMAVADSEKWMRDGKWAPVFQNTVSQVRELLGRYQLGVAPDFEYMADVLKFVWSEMYGPGLKVGSDKSRDEVATDRAELAASRAEREAKFVKQAYERLLERKQSGT